MTTVDPLAILRAALGDTFRIDRELGGGGMSRVFLAEETRLGRRVVLKVLPPDLAHVLSAERFEREVRVAARLQHPHIVPLLAAGRAGEMLYYTMPLVDGESLRSRLDEKGELPVAEATRLFREIADALAYAHRQGVVHRDIKPDNVLLSHRHAMVTDFGVAHAVSEAVGGGRLTATGMAVGTPAYMAPEQAAAGPTDHRADLYALGLVAYEMFAGHPPFSGATPQALVAAHMTQVPRPLIEARPSIPPPLSAIVHRCLEKRAADRFESAEELATALDRIASTLESSGSAMTTAAAPMSRRALLAGGAAVGLLALGFGAGAALLRRGSSTMPSYRRLTFRRGMIRTARFGPDHQTVLYGALWDGDDCRVYTVRPESPESSPLALPAAAPLAVSAGGEIALALGRHYRGIMTYGTLARVPISGGAPRPLQEHVKYADWTPDGRELALVRRAGEQEQLEFPSGKIVATPEKPGGGFSFVRVAPSGDLVAAFELDDRNFLFGRVVIVDRSGRKHVTSSRYANVFGLAWSGPDVWFTAADELPLFRNALYTMSTSGEVQVIARVPGNTSLHDIAPDGRLLIARTDDRTGMSVRAPGADGERDLSWLDGTNIADISRDGRQILFHEYGVGGGPRGSAYLRGTDGAPAVRLAEGLGLAISHDGQWAIVQIADAPHLEVVPTGPGESFRVERAGLALLDARWLPDGRSLVARARADRGAPRLYLLELRGTATRAVTPGTADAGVQSWALSPDGRAVAVSIGGKVRMYSTEAGAERPLPSAGDGSRVVGWIERGVLISEDPSSGVVLVVAPESGRREPWVELRPLDPAGIMSLDPGTLVATPDGRGYGYSWHRAISDLYLVDGLR